MSIHSPPRTTLPLLHGLLQVTRLLREERDPTRFVDAIASTVSSALGFRTVAINLYRPAEGDFQVATVHGSEAARDALLGSTRSLGDWAPYFAERFLHRGAYVIPHGEVDWEGVPSHVPDLEVPGDPDAWHPEDALLVPMRGADGTLLAVISVDEPSSGLRATDEQIDVLVAFAEHVISALEGARADAAAAGDRTALARLLDVSASLVELDSVEAVLESVASGIREALRFEKVAVCIASEDGRFIPAGTAGWDEGDPGLDFTLTDADLDVLFVPEFELDGCYLIANDVARALVPDGSNYHSRRGAAGPSAWSRHWLLVPLVERDGSRRGFVWVDDPADSLLPSRERLQALRTFANQATMALRAAVDFELLNRRNRELGALHETTVALLDRLDLDDVLEAILTSAASLLSAPHGFLYLVNGDPHELDLRAHKGFEEIPPPRVVRRGEGVTGTVLATAEAVVVDDYRSWASRLPQLADAALASVVAVPLRSGADVVGVLGLAQEDPNLKIGTAELDLLRRFSHLASLALENARLYAEAQRQLAERSLLNEQLRQSQKLESIGRLAGGIAHDFNNLLTAIRGYAELMLLDFDGGGVPSADSAREIARAAERAASLTGQLLAFSRKQVLRPQLIDLNGAIEGMAAMLGRTIGEDIVLRTELDRGLGPILADPTQIEQVVLNLAINARDAMPQGGSLALRTGPLELREGAELPHPDLHPGSYVTLQVEDTGAGIEPEVAERVFEPFYTTKEVGQGTGLGLATVHGIVSQSGGAIWLASTPGEGTCFTVCLPQAAAL